MNINDLKNFSKVKIKFGQNNDGVISWKEPVESEVVFMTENGLKKTIIIDNKTFEIERDYIIVDGNVCFRHDKSKYLYLLCDINEVKINNQIKEDRMDFQDLIKHLRKHNVRRVIFDNGGELII